MTDLLALGSDLPTADLTPGTVLIEEGTRPGRLLVLVSGEVVVEHDGVPFARIDSPGAVFGEMSAVLDRAATATVRAVGDVRVHVVDDPVRFLTDTPGAALAVLRTTASRLDGMTQYLVDVKRQFADQAGHLGLVDQILDTLVHHQGPGARTGSARDPEGDHHHEHD
ncbi:Crp/Fnr family transcriptional regulator [Nocardioides guangzhouensis]|uniref:Crp/Fnr family transcriptional regulator n=1 Tax=Nocardioides guangzhouensis TaxID=2497878 RepID=UPI0014385D56|nr:cyclic nucleotide-binding domain-containing protein [Nocardioides guangzhouensis]